MPSSALYIQDSNNQWWSLTVDNFGIFHSATTTTQNAVPLYLSDEGGSETSYRLGITTQGILTTTAVTYSADYPVSIAVQAPNGGSYELSLNASGILNDVGILPNWLFLLPFSMFCDVACNDALWNLQIRTGVALALISWVNTGIPPIPVYNFQISYLQLPGVLAWRIASNRTFALTMAKYGYPPA